MVSSDPGKLSKCDTCDVIDVGGNATPHHHACPVPFLSEVASGRHNRCESLSPDRPQERCEFYRGHLFAHRRGDLHWRFDVKSEAAPETPITAWAIIDAYGLDFYRGSALQFLLAGDPEEARRYIDKSIEREK